MIHEGLRLHIYKPSMLNEKSPAIPSIGWQEIALIRCLRSYAPKQWNGTRLVLPDVPDVLSYFKFGVVYDRYILCLE